MTDPGRHTRGYRWTAADTAQLIALHGQGMTLHQIAQTMGCSKATINKYAAMEKLSFDRSQTEAATVAHSVDAKARRQAAADRLWALFDDAATHAESVRDGQFKTLIKGDRGADAQATLDFIPPDNRRNLAASLTQLVNAATKIEAIDNDSGTADAISMLGKLAHAIGLSDDVDDTTDDDPA